MCGEKGFAEDRIRNGAKKLAKARQGSTQGRLDGFFKVLTPAGNNKRKSNESANGSAGKKAKGGSKGAFRKR